VEFAKVLVLVDDSQRGFWMADQRWDVNEWREYDRCTLDGKSFTDTLELVNECEKRSKTGFLYIVTDGHLWGDPEGGSKLLEAATAILNFRLGVVYSSDPQIGKSLAGADTIMAITRDESAESVRRIKEFFDTGQKPSVYALDETARQLSTAIHHLENLALPLKLDIETLQSCGADSKTVREVYEDYFNPVDPIGYLLPNRAFAGGRAGIEGEAVNVLNLISRMVDNAGENLLDQYRERDAISPLKVRSEWSLDDVRNQALANCNSQEWLVEALSHVAARISELAEQLRLVRKATVEQRKTQK
jgi:hypothetical protein